MRSGGKKYGITESISSLEEIIEIIGSVGNSTYVSIRPYLNITLGDNNTLKLCEDDINIEISDNGRNSLQVQEQGHFKRHILKPYLVTNKRNL